jgi:hypothetical protein
LALAGVPHWPGGTQAALGFMAESARAAAAKG